MEVLNLKNIKFENNNQCFEFILSRISKNLDKKEKYKLTTNFQLGSFFQDFLEKHEKIEINLTFNKEYKIGEIKNFEVFINPIMLWNSLIIKIENSKELIKEYKVNTDIDLI